MADEETTNDISGMSGPHINPADGAEINEMKMQTANGVNDSYVVDAKNFLLPEMGDYYLGAVDDMYLRKIDEIVSGKEEGQGNGEDAAFYTETPPVDEPGHKNGVYCIDARIDLDDEDVKMGLLDGGTIFIPVDNICVPPDDDASKQAKLDLKNLCSKTQGKYGRTSRPGILVHLAGVNMPSTPKWAHVDGVNRDDFEFKTEAKEDGSTQQYVNIGGDWRPVTDYSEQDGVATFDYCFQEGSGNQESAYQAAQDMRDTLDRMSHDYGSNNTHDGRIRIVLDDSMPSSEYFPSFGGDIRQDIGSRSMLSNDANDGDVGHYSTNAYCSMPQFMGSIYAKADGKWVNMGKKMLANGYDGVSPQSDYGGAHQDIMDLPSYDKDNHTYADAYFKVMSEIDDRRKIQKDIFGQDWDALSEWTVTIGDVTLFVPPVNITISVETDNKRIPMLRAKGSADKTGHHVTRNLQMTVYFNEDRGINGQPYDMTARNGGALHYSMNGLRDIVAQFKFCPFLPITNNYINQTLCIDAVTTPSLSVSSVPGFPKLVQATLTMTEFSYQVYMPELFQPSQFEDSYRNFFCDSINWATFRYYYQRPLLRGDELAAKNYSFNSESFYKKTLENRTMLLPMKFKNSGIKFYIADSNYIDQMAKAKRGLAENKANNDIQIDEDEKKAISEFGSLNKAIRDEMNSSEFREKLKECQDPMFIDKLPDERTYNTMVDADGLTTSNGKPCSKEVSRSLSSALAMVKKAAQNAARSSGMEIVSARYCKYAVDDENDNTKKHMCYALCLRVNSPYLHQYDNLNDLKADAGAYTNMSPDEFFKERMLVVPISTVASYENGKYATEGGFSPMLDTPDMQFLDWCGSYNPNKKDKTEMVSAINMGKLEDLPYDEYGSSDYIVTQWSAAMVNHISGISLKTVSGSAPQYLGGEDVVFHIEIETQSRDAAQQLTTLQSVVSSMARQYHSVMPCWPMRVESEFTAFFGVFDAEIDSVTTSTVQGYPNLYHISMELHSIDRTLRQREGLAKIEAQASGNIYNKSFEQQSVMDYFNIESRLAKAELYPDLELPTLDDMKQLGYEFVRYKFQDDRVYVDPDFDVIYPNTLTSQVIREACMNVGSTMQKAGLGTKLEDAMGGSATVQPQPKKGAKVTEENDVAKGQKEAMKQATDAAYQQRAKNLAENLKTGSDGLNRLESSGATETWDVCEAIRPMFLEERYKHEIKSFRAQCNANGQDPDEECQHMTENEQQELDAIQQAQAAQKGIPGPLTMSASGLGAQAAQVASNGMTQVPMKAATTSVVGNMIAAKKTQEANELQQKNMAEDQEKSKGMNTNGDTDNTGDNSKTDQPDGSQHLSYAEGKWAYKAMADARKAANEIQYYLENTYINENVYDDNGNKIDPNNPDEVENGASATEVIADTVKEASEKGAIGSAAKILDAGMQGVVENAITQPEETPTIGGTAETEAKAETRQKYEFATGKIKRTMDDTVNKFLSDPKIKEIMDLLKCKDSEKLRSVIDDIVFSAACSATGVKEYSNKKDSTEWYPDPQYVGVKIGGEQDTGGKVVTNDVNDAVENAIEFGMFGIKQYDRETIEAITGDTTIDPWNADYESVNTTHYLLDPYYRYNTVETIKAYKRGCITNPKFATVAFLRLCLFWIKHLIDIDAIPSINHDIMRNATAHELEIEQTQTQQGIPKEVAGEMQDHIDFFNRNIEAVDAGKFWCGAALAMTDGSTNIMNRIDNRDYGGLDSFVMGVAKPSAIIPASEKDAVRIRKMILSLVGLGRIRNQNAIGVVSNHPGQEYAFNTTEQLYVNAAEDPSVFMGHACHDMIVNDARGRMLRAFPTFYIMLIDEGRENGRYKLHDNFYSTMNIVSLEIVKSRKNPADLANIQMENFFNTYTTDSSDGDVIDSTSAHKGAGFLDVASSIFTPEAYMQKQEEKRQRASKQDKIRLRPGARIHIRMGYGSNAAMMPVVFNGVIAECDAKDIVTITAQGDGIELMNPMLDDSNSYEVADGHNGNDWRPHPDIENSATPKNIMNGILTSHGGYIKDALKNAPVIGQMINTNPYGIYHFGNPDFKQIVKSGEPTQNIYEACKKPAWGKDDSITAQYASDGATEINFEVLGKTVWDAANICTSVSPDYICAVAPFEFRSTLFSGAPRYYYAYKYKRMNGAIIERREPYQQYHIYTSATDIIGNGIRASSKDMKTVALGLYEIAETGNIKSQKRVGPLYVDYDIYPEWQKTMMVNTNLYGKGAPIVGVLTNTLANDLLDYSFDETGTVESHEKIAWRMTAHALKDSVRDMYCGDLVVFGDASIKPFDRLYINDTYEGFAGQVTAKEVVHSFNANEGFITTISPDVICAVDDPFEIPVQQGFDMCCTEVAGFTALMGYSAMAWHCKTAASVKGMDEGIENLGRKINNSKAMKYAKKWSGYNTIRDSKIANNFGRYINSVAGKSKNAVKGTKAAKTAVKMAKAGKTAAQGFKIGRAALAAGGIIAGGAAAVLASPAILAGLAVTAGVTILTSFVSNALDRTLKNLQVLTIYPIKRFGIAYTAGVEGSKGLVYGSPSYNDQGALTSCLSKLCGSSDNGAINFLNSMLFDDSTIHAADKLKRQEGLTKDNGDPMYTENMMNGFLKSVAGAQSDMPTDYRAMQVAHLASAPEELSASYQHYAMLDTDKYENDPKLRNFRLVSNDDRIKPYINEQFFLILHETPALNKGKRVDSKILNLNGQQSYVKSIQYQNKDGSGLYDLPLLHPNAINVLYEVLRRAKNNMPSANSSDQFEAYEQTKGSFIALKSALRIGDKDSRSSTGFSFILEPHGNAVDAFAKAVKQFHEEIEQDGKNNELYNKVLFESKNIGDSEVAFTVRMPSIAYSDQPAAEDTEGATTSNDPNDGQNDDGDGDSGASQQAEEETENGGEE